MDSIERVAARTVLGGADSRPITNLTGSIRETRQATSFLITMGNSSERINELGSKSSIAFAGIGGAADFSA